MDVDAAFSVDEQDAGISNAGCVTTYFVITHGTSLSRASQCDGMKFYIGFYMIP